MVTSLSDDLEKPPISAQKGSGWGRIIDLPGFKKFLERVRRSARKPGREAPGNHKNLGIALSGPKRPQNDTPPMPKLVLHLREAFAQGAPDLPSQRGAASHTHRHVRLLLGHPACLQSPALGYYWALDDPETNWRRFWGHSAPEDGRISRFEAILRSISLV